MGKVEELVAIVDKNNKVLDYKKYSELLDTDTWRIVSIWVENSHGEILLQQRSFNKSIAPGVWTPAAEGTVTEDDSYLETAIRELEEEIGLSSVELTPTQLLYIKASYGSRFMQGYVVHCDWPIEQFVKQDDEVEQLLWVDKKQLLEELGDKRSHSREYPSAYKSWPKLFNL